MMNFKKIDIFLDGRNLSRSVCIRLWHQNQLFKVVDENTAYSKIILDKNRKVGYNYYIQYNKGIICV